MTSLVSRSSTRYNIYLPVISPSGVYCTMCWCLVPSFQLFTLVFRSGKLVHGTIYTTRLASFSFYLGVYCTRDGSRAEFVGGC